MRRIFITGYQAYSDTKLYDLTLSMFVARRWSHVLVNALDPGWVPTRLGGTNAPGNLRDGATTQAWLAVSLVAVAVENALSVETFRERQVALADERDRLGLLLDVTNAVVCEVPAGRPARANKVFK
jgi:NAD(P)-dependent dehydrogenase (short-subunit alcohol dehydrogenase family)